MFFFKFPAPYGLALTSAIKYGDQQKYPVFTHDYHALHNITDESWEGKSSLLKIPTSKILQSSPECMQFQEGIR